MRHFARFTNTLSKEVENSAHATAIHNTPYTFRRIHETQRATPAMSVGY